jgi:pre-rRNA-processing protein TSR4
MARESGDVDKRCAKEIDLGFLIEDTPSWKLEGRFFPSKLGGKPAWLALGKPPSLAQLSCGTCKKPMSFLLQIYAPIEAGDDDQEKVDTFHRSLFVFLCRSALCSEGNVAVFRCQLARRNSYYPFEPCDEDDEKHVPGTRLGDRTATCWVCGVPTDGKKCGACKVASYCSPEHQKMDWRGGHKAKCGSENEPGSSENSKWLCYHF